MGDAPAVPFTTRLLRRPAEPVHGTIFVPVSAAPRAAVLLIGGSGGSEPSYVAEPLASAGIAALSVAYFARPGLPGQLRDIPLEYFFSALQVLRDQLPPDTPLAVLGMSRGSEAAMLTAIGSGVRVHGVLVTVPGNIVAGSRPPGGPAWLLDGRPLPYASHAHLTYEDPRPHIPVEQGPGPVFLLAAGADRVWPSAAMARALSRRLREHGDPHGHVLLEYPSAGHGIGYLIPRLPAGLLPPELTDTDQDRVARADAWPKAVQFIRQLGSPDPAGERHECGPRLVSTDPSTRNSHWFWQGSITKQGPSYSVMAFHVVPSRSKPFYYAGQEGDEDRRLPYLPLRWSAPCASV